jgi:dTDP-4-dehydrorhamnose 3,5-epimerase
MGQIKVDKNVGGIEGLCIITPTVHGDNRGYFMETYNERDMEEVGIHVSFVQDNQSMSTRGVLRGLHFQKHYPQCKLVRVIRGRVFDAAVDLRAHSKTYGKWYGVELTEENKRQFLIPEGFAHGFLVLSDVAEFCYKVNDFGILMTREGWLGMTLKLVLFGPKLLVPTPGSADAASYALADGTKLNLSEKDQRWGNIVTQQQGE